MGHWSQEQGSEMDGQLPLAPLPPLLSPNPPLPSQCNQGYPSPSLGWWQPSQQQQHCQLLHI